MRFIQLVKRVVPLITFAISPSIYADDLITIYHQAADYDAQYQTAELAYASALEVRTQAKAAFLPQVAASASATLNDINNDRDESYTGNKFTLSLNQALYNQSSQIAIKQADLTITQAQSELASAKQDLILRTAESYFGVLAAKDNLQFASSEKKAIEQKLEQAERRFEVGLIAVTDVKEAQAAYDLAVAEEIAASNSLSNAKEALRVMTGKHDQPLSPLAQQTPLVSPEPDNSEKWVETAETSNLSLRIAEINAEIATQQINSARSGHFPTLGAGVNYSKTSQEGGIRESEAGVLLLKLDVPIYSGGLVSSQVRQAKSQARRAARLYELNKRTTAQLTRNAFNGVVASISRVKAFYQAFQSTKIAAEATETGFEVGTRTAVDVLQSLRDTYRALANYSNARYDYILNTLELKQAAGILDSADLEAINQWLVTE